MVAGHHHLAAGHGAGLAAAHVGDFQWIGGLIIDVANPHRGAVQANAHRGSGVIELAVVKAGGDDVLHVAAGRRAGNHGAHQEPGNGGVAVGKVKDVGFLHPPRVVVDVEVEVAETRVVAAPSGAGWQRIDADVPHAVGQRLDGAQGFIAHAGLFLQVGPIVGVGEVVGLRLGRHAFKMVALVSKKARQVGLSRRRQRQAHQDFRIGQIAYSEVVGAERGLVEECAAR